MMKLITECNTGNEINKDCSYEELTSKLSEENDDEYLGDCNLFDLVLQDVSDIMNFQIATFTMSLICANRIICRNISKFRTDFKIKNFFRITNRGKQICYVIVSCLKPFWIMSSLKSFIKGTKTFQILDEQQNGAFIWVRLT